MEVLGEQLHLSSFHHCIAQQWHLNNVKPIRNSFFTLFLKKACLDLSFHIRFFSIIWNRISFDVGKNEPLLSLELNVTGNMWLLHVQVNKLIFFPRRLWSHSSGVQKILIAIQFGLQPSKKRNHSVWLERCPSHDSYTYTHPYTRCCDWIFLVTTLF